MNIMLLGPPGAGKGTQAQFLEETLRIPKISTGDMLRKEIQSGSDLGKQAQREMDAGRLVPDPLVIALLKNRIEAPDCQGGFLLDGFPRTLPQAQALTDAGIRLDYVIALDVEEEALVRRLSGRFIHAASGRTYHTDYNPPKVPGKDDVTGEPLVQREDDKSETVRNRLQVYRQQTMPLLQYYQQISADSAASAPRYVKVDGLASVEEVRMAIEASLGLRGVHA